MKIVMFTNTYKPHVGGVANAVDALAGGLRKQGHAVVVVAPTFPGTEVDFEGDGETIRVPSVQNFNGSDFSVRLPIPFALSDAMDSIAPDIIHSHHPFLLGDTAVRMARRFNVPLIFTHHTRYEKYTHYVSESSARLPQFAATLATEYANMCSGVIAPSESIEELVKRRGVTVPVTTIATGIDTRRYISCDPLRFRRTFYDSDQPLKLIGHLGRLSQEKNLQYLIEAVADVLQKDPETRFLVAGDGPMRETMERYFADRDLASKVKFCGVLEGQDKIDFYSSLDLFAFSSTTETQGLVVAEAMSASIPVVALDAPGVREVVTHENGALVDQGADTPEFAAAILARLADDSGQPARRKAALRTASRFSIEATVDSTARFYRERIDNHATEKSDVLPEALDPLLQRITAEWELVSEKAAAIVKSAMRATGS